MHGALFTRYTALLAASLLTIGAVPTSAFAATEQEQLVTKAETTFSNFERDPDMKWFRDNIGKAKAVLIAPEIVKAGFILGGSGGRGVLLARNAKTGKWVGPAFYTLATGSVGFQAGISVSEVVMLVMTEKGLNSLLSTSFKVGGDVSVAAGPVGAGAKSNIAADLISYSRAKGIYGGLNLDGTVVSTNDEWNSAYYGKAVTPPDILIRQNVRNPQAIPLQRQVAKAAAKK
jgi:lipid-binding SYLF domain-containing protein